MAFGASVRRESESCHADANGRNTDPVTGSQSGNAELWQNGTFADPFAKGRTISGVMIPLKDASGNDIGGLVMIFRRHSGDTEKALYLKALTVRDGLARQIPNYPALFAAAN